MPRSDHTPSRYRHPQRHEAYCERLLAMQAHCERHDLGFAEQMIRLIDDWLARHGAADALCDMAARSEDIERATVMRVLRGSIEQRDPYDGLLVFRFIDDLTIQGCGACIRNAADGIAVSRAVRAEVRRRGLKLSRRGGNRPGRTEVI